MNFNEVKELKVRLTFLEDVLGTSSANPELHAEFIASKAPDAEKREEEVARIGTEEAIEKAMTIFPRDDDGRPFMWDYQFKGFLKDSVGALRKVTGSESSKIKSYKKEIDGTIFVKERVIPYIFDGGIGNCQRPLRASTAQGERIALANSETVPAGATVEFTIQMLCPNLHEKMIRECLDYGRFRGIGQWRNSGKGKFTWEEC